MNSKYFFFIEFVFELRAIRQTRKNNNCLLDSMRLLLRRIIVIIFFRL